MFEGVGRGVPGVVAWPRCGWIPQMGWIHSGFLPVHFNPVEMGKKVDMIILIKG